MAGHDAGSLKALLKEIKKALGSLMRQTDQYWVKFLNITQYSINTSPHSTLEYKTPYIVLFGHDPVEGLASFGISEEMLLK